MEHDINWTPESIAKFWDNYSSDFGRQFLYFSCQRGASLLRQVKKIIDIGGCVMDYGCGIGSLLCMLDDNEKVLYGVDYSLKSLEEAERTLPRARFDVAGESVPGRYFNTVFCLEVIEHMSKSDALEVLKKIHGMLTVGGHIVLTTPYNENHKAHLIECPGCGCIYHDCQHMASYNTYGVEVLGHVAGFEKVVCDKRFFCPDPRIYLASLTGRMSGAKCPECGESFSPKKSFRNKLKSMNIFNVLYVGKKV